MPKRSILLLIGLLALVVALLMPATAPTQALGGWDLYMTGWALEDTGARCGTDCLAIVQASGGTNWNASGAVSNSSSNCGGLGSYNWGSMDPWLSCWSPNGSVFHLTYTPYSNATFTMWLRHSCPTGGGYYYSPTHSWGFDASGGLCLAGGCHKSHHFGTSQLNKPNGGCLPGI